MKNKNNILILSCIAASVMFLHGCTSKPNDTTMAGEVEIYDPFEKTNRAVFAFNNAIDDAVIHPIAKGYNTAVPAPARTGVDNFLNNIKSPVTFANQALQGDVEGAGNVLVRVTINTLLGLGGLVDLAAHEGIEYESEDFGQTLAVWGVDHGPYLVVPIIGPSSLRDYAGYIVDSVADPLRWYLYNIDHEEIYYGKVGVQYLALRASLVDTLEELEASSIDYYAATRSVYYQHREALVNDQDPELGASADIPDYDDMDY